MTTAKKPDISQITMISLLPKRVNFVFNGKIYIQLDTVGMESPFGPVSANVFTLHYKKK